MGLTVLRESCVKQLLLAVACVFVAFNSHAQIQTPEECILDTLKSGSSLGAMVYTQCVKKYIIEIAPTVNFVSPKGQVGGATLKYLQGQQTASGETILPKYELTIKNDSNQILIQAMIVITNHKTALSVTYRLSAYTPIQPNSAGTLRADVLPVANREEFWKEHGWQLAGIKLVNPQ